MSDYYCIEPEVCGSFDDGTIVDRSTHPPGIENLHFCFDGWSGDQLVEGFPCFLATDELAEQFTRHGFTGFELAAVKVSTSSEYEDLQPGEKLPPFQWLKITGVPGKDDFGIEQKDLRLVVSKRAWAIIRPVCTDDCEVEDYKG
jgi:hypothetical protein